VDGFKAMLAEKMKLELEMKKRYTVARLRWIKAINRVLIQNYVQKVKVRLGLCTPEPALTPPPSDRRPKIFRRSIDNAYLSENNNNMKSPNSLPNIGKPSPLHIMNHNNVLSPAGSLPTLSPSHADHGPHQSEKRRRRTQRTQDGKLLTRKSYESLPSPEAKLTLSCPSNDSVPSLLQSYASVSTKLVPEVSVPMLVDIREHSTRAHRLARL
jgi:hypothetical protein